MPDLRLWPQQIQLDALSLWYAENTPVAPSKIYQQLLVDSLARVVVSSRETAPTLERGE